MLQLTFLGTSAGVPTKQRNVTALAIECLNPYQSRSNQTRKKSRPWILIDCGEGTQQQLQHTPLSLTQLTAICITHVHGDHCYGLPGLLASSAMSGRKDPLTIIAPQAIAKLLDTVTLTTELYFPFDIHFIAIENVLSDDKVTIDLEIDRSHEIAIDITPLSHRVPSYGFGLTQTLHRRVLNTDKLKTDNIAPSSLWGKLQQGEDVITQEGKTLHSADYVDDEIQRTRVVVAGDNDTPACLNQALQHTDLLVHEATYTAEVLAKIKHKNSDFDPMHSSAKQVGKFAQEIGINNLILTHFSARYQSFDNPASSTPNMGHIRVEAQDVYHGNLWLAADFAQYSVAGLSTAAQDNSSLTQHDSSQSNQGKSADPIQPNQVQFLGDARKL